MALLSLGIDGVEIRGHTHRRRAGIGGAKSPMASDGHGSAHQAKQRGPIRNQRNRLNVGLRMLPDQVAGLLNEARVESLSTSSGTTALQVERPRANVIAGILDGRGGYEVVGGLFERKFRLHLAP